MLNIPQQNLLKYNLSRIEIQCKYIYIYIYIYIRYVSTYLIVGIDKEKNGFLKNNLENNFTIKLPSYTNHKLLFTELLAL